MLLLLSAAAARTHDRQSRLGYSKQVLGGIFQFCSRFHRLLIPFQSVDFFMLTDFLVRFSFYLANTLSSNAKNFSDFFQSVGVAVSKPMAHLQNFPLLGRQVA